MPQILATFWDISPPLFVCLSLTRARESSLVGPLTLAICSPVSLLQRLSSYRRPRTPPPTHTHTHTHVAGGWTARPRSDVALRGPNGQRLAALDLIRAAAGSQFAACPISHRPTGHAFRTAEARSSNKRGGLNRGWLFWQTNEPAYINSALLLATSYDVACAM